MSASPATHAAHLLAWVQRDLQALIGVVERLAVQVAALSGPQADKRLTSIFEYQGRQHSVHELAALAGASYQTMYSRLKTLGMSPQEAVALGPAEKRRTKAEIEADAAAKVSKPVGPSGVRHEFHGEQLTLMEIAQRAGVSYATMHGRMRVGLTAEQAAAGKRGDQKTPASVAPAPPTEPAPRKTTAKRYPFEGGQLTVKELASLAGCSAAAMAVRLGKVSPAEAVAQGAVAHMGPKTKRAGVASAERPTGGVTMLHEDRAAFKPGDEPVIPPGLVPDVRKTPPGRFEPIDAVPVFGALKPGQYLDSGSAWARAAVGGRR